MHFNYVVRTSRPNYPQEFAETADLASAFARLAKSSDYPVSRHVTISGISVAWDLLLHARTSGVERSRARHGGGDFEIWFQRASSSGHS